jgi:enoyl-CoA hydratase/carnithine racemase
MMSDLVETRLIGNVGLVQMNRPEKRNAMSSALLQALIGALGDFRADSSADAVVITGEGGAFSAGADTAEQTDTAGALARVRLFNRLYEQVSGYPKPTVAAIDGPCIGGGAEVATACDLRVGTPRAVFRFPGAQLSIPVGAARLPLLVGLSHAKDLLLTARPATAQEALRMGLLNRLVERGELEHESVALAAAMAANPGAHQSKRLLAEASELSPRVSRESRALYRWQTRGR